jgi:hypothetical protein
MHICLLVQGAVVLLRSFPNAKRQDILKMLGSSELF